MEIRKLYKILLFSVCLALTIPITLLAAPVQNDVSKITFTIKGQSLYANNRPVVLQTYKPNGDGLTGLSGYYFNKIIDISAIQRKRDPWTPQLAGQFTRSITDEPNVSVSLRRREYESVFIDKTGIVFPGNMRSMKKGGPYIDLTLLAPKIRTVIPLDGLSVKISSKTKGTLETERKSPHIIVVKNVPKETLLVTVTEKKSKKKWTGKLYPVFRGSAPGAIFYWVENVTVGERMDKDPKYE